MKKILITGMNKAQTTRDFYKKQELNVVPSHSSLIKCLEDMGFEVDQRAVSILEDLSSYDKIICFIHSPKAFCQQLFTGLYAAQYNDKVIYAIDDWQCDQILGSIKTFKNFFEPTTSDSTCEYVMSLQQNDYTLRQILDKKEMFVNALYKISSGQNKLLVTAFNNGDVKLLKTGFSNVFAYNPNPYHENRTLFNNFLRGGDEEFSVNNKKNEWNFASLVQGKTKKWLDKQEFTWPVNCFGSKRGIHKCVRLKEGDMCQVFAEQWGSLMPSYYHAGSGWWRARPLQIADVGSVLVTQSDKEAIIYGDAYTGLSASIVEGMSEESLRALAKRQNECLYTNHPLDKKFQQLQIEAVLS